MRISDWSSDVCSSDLQSFFGGRALDGRFYNARAVYLIREPVQPLDEMVLSRIAVPVVAEKRLHFSIEEMAHRHEEIFARLGLWNEAHGLQVRICDEDFPRAPDIVARRRRIDFVFIEIGRAHVLNSSH